MDQVVELLKEKAELKEKLSQLKLKHAVVVYNGYSNLAKKVTALTKVASEDIQAYTDAKADKTKSQDEIKLLGRKAEMSIVAANFKIDQLANWAKRVREWEAREAVTSE